jgi:hypothetical protein
VALRSPLIGTYSVYVISTDLGGFLFVGVF